MCGSGRVRSVNIIRFFMNYILLAISIYLIMLYLYSVNSFTFMNKNAQLQSAVNNGFETNKLQNIRPNLPKKESIGILIPSTTRMMKKPNISTFTLTKHCLPSITATFQKQYTYNIYIGVEKNDFLQSQRTVIEKSYERVYIVTVPGHTFTAATNYIANRALKDGMDYFVRINDDTVFETFNWTSIAIENLKKLNPPMIGVVGPICKEGNIAILTQDMVHRTHVEIFKYYYPPIFDNLWTDDWITKVYKPLRSKKLTNWQVKHLIRANGRRYDANRSQESLLKGVIESDKKRLKDYISEIEKHINNSRYGYVI
ncbi:uncharacterized protein LOC123566049 [Mercenaria mercenaria]|uniref:uncharacterized protein LOC123566049 n=1 Tax=Mercenaria mercenaria TaxID=6596 RepID=UPI00234F3DD7|nr:uncharacterized protein LOC123566049 [Mercenaria mercenaria]